MEVSATEALDTRKEFVEPELLDLGIACTGDCVGGGGNAWGIVAY